MDMTEADARRAITTIVFDMYGVIIEESKGRFIPFVQERIPTIARETIVEHFSAAGIGSITAKEFFARLGFGGDHRRYQTEYLSDYLTLDPGFYGCAAVLGRQYELTLLSNDLHEWNAFLMHHYRIADAIKKTTVSGEAGTRKPEARIFEIHLDRYAKSATECLFIDNSVRNLRTAEAMGMATVLFDRDQEPYEGLAVRDFAELAALVERQFRPGRKPGVNATR